MKVRTPTSNESIRSFIRTIDVFSVLLAAPIAMGLRDPSLFSLEKLGVTVGYCGVGFAAGLLMVIVFQLGRGMGHVSTREARSVVTASLSAVALNAVCAFSVDRLDYIPRSLPLIQFLVLCGLMLGGRSLVARPARFAGIALRNHLLAPSTLLINANEYALSYLGVLDAFNVDRTDIVAILDKNPKLFGRALLGHPIIGPPSALKRVIQEYKLHDVEITRVLVCGNRPVTDNTSCREIEEDCQIENVELKYLSDIFGIKLSGSVETKNDCQQSEVWSQEYRLLKRASDLLLSCALGIAVLPALILVALGVYIDLGWPIIFWQRRIGYRGRPFLIFKFRTLHPPFDRQGNFVEEDRRISYFGSFLRRTHLDELPQLWNVISGEMSFVGPRPLLANEQPTGTQLRLNVRPGITGWAQINGGRQITPQEKGLLDEWYVRHATLRLDLGIIFSTLGIVRQVGSAKTDKLDGGSLAMAGIEGLRPSPASSGDRWFSRFFC